MKCVKWLGAYVGIGVLSSILGAKYDIHDTDPAHVPVQVLLWPLEWVVVLRTELSGALEREGE